LARNLSYLDTSDREKECSDQSLPQNIFAVKKDKLQYKQLPVKWLPSMQLKENAIMQFIV